MSGVKNKIVIAYEECHRVNENNELEKMCNRCGEWLLCNLDYFYKNDKSPDGYFPYCKQCNINKGKETFANTPLEIRKAKRKIEYVKHKEEENERSKGWRERNLEHKQKYQLNYQRSNPDIIKRCAEKHQHKKHNITDEQWDNCKKYFDYECAYCGLPIEEHYVPYRGKIILSDFHKEHIDDKGNNELDNCVPSCKSCNSKKWEFDFELWYNENNPRFSQERLDKINKWRNEDYKLFIKTK